MSRVSHRAALYAARMGDLLYEAKTELREEEFADVISLAAIAISRQFGDAIEDWWTKTGGEDG